MPHLWPRGTVGLGLVMALVSTPMAAQSVGSAPSAATRAAFLRTIQRPATPLAPSPAAIHEESGFTFERLSIASEPTERVPLLVVKPSHRTERLPVVIVLHGTGGSKESMRPRLDALAARGYLAIAIDARHHGERATPIPGLVNPYESAMLRAFQTGEGHPYLYDTVWDVLRLVDYLVARADVDSTRLGLIGLSKGGTEAYLAAAADPRIAVVVPLIGVQRFSWSLRHAAAWEARVWTFRQAVESSAAASNARVGPEFLKRFYDRIAPGLLDTFDGPAMLPLIAPRAMLVVNGDSDPRSPMGGVREATAAATYAYQAASVPERFCFLLEENAAHEVTPAASQAMMAWLDRWLRPTVRENRRHAV